MALIRWFLHSACHVLGYPIDTTNGSEGLKGQYESSSVNNFNKDVEEYDELDHPSSGGFQMPLHYPRYTKAEYERMEEWKVDLLLKQYGLSFNGTLDEKRAFAMGAFLWPDQY